MLGTAAALGITAASGMEFTLLTIQVYAITDQDIHEICYTLFFVQWQKL